MNPKKLLKNKQEEWLFRNISTSAKMDANSNKKSWRMHRRREN